MGGVEGGTNQKAFEGHYPEGQSSAVIYWKKIGALSIADSGPALSVYFLLSTERTSVS